MSAYVPKDQWDLIMQSVVQAGAAAGRTDKHGIWAVPPVRMGLRRDVHTAKHAMPSALLAVFATGGRICALWAYCSCCEACAIWYNDRGQGQA